jgi:hypothetical protein
VTLEEFAKLVAEMRSAQKEYFRTRSTSSLETSKRLEKQVDQALKETAGKQSQLFS